MFNPTSSQFGVVNVNLGRSSDPQVEERVLEDVGSYGKQLGKIGDVLRILLAHSTPANLTPQEKAAIDDLRGQLDAIDEIKAQTSKVPAPQKSRSMITSN